MKHHLHLVSDTTDTLTIEWLTAKYSNFTKNKTYVAQAPFRYIKNGPWTGFRITDDDGDYYTLPPHRAGLDYRIIQGNYRICDNAHLR